MPPDVRVPPTPGPETSPIRPSSETDPQPATSEWLFGEDYVGQILRWSSIFAAVGGVVGWLITTEVAFALGLWVGAAVDIGTFRVLARRGAAAIEGEGSNVWPVGALIVRLAAKAVLLLVAVLLPWPAAFWGVLGGVLVVELMIVVVGIVRSSTTMFRARGGTGGGAKS